MTTSGTHKKFIIWYFILHFSFVISIKGEISLPFVKSVGIAINCALVFLSESFKSFLLLFKKLLIEAFGCSYKNHDIFAISIIFELPKAIIKSGFTIFMCSNALFIDETFG